MIRHALACLCATACWTLTTTAFAGGLYFNDRGVRPMARAGAFVAGADDGGAVWYNPAGLADTKNGVMMDGTLSFFNGKFTRVDGVDAMGSTRPTVEQSNMKLPIPTLAITHDLGTRRAQFAIGVLAPNVVLAEWPSEVQQGQQRVPAPQRYSLISMHGSIAANVFVGAGVRLPKGFSLGVDVMLVAGQLKLNQMLTGCDGALCTFTEDPEYDANVTVRLPFVTATAVAGITYEYGMMRIGASVMTPYAMKGTADLNVALPPAAIFDDATVNGDKAKTRVDFPLIARAGLQLQPFDPLKVEFAFVWEQWSRQQEITLTPQNVTINNVTGIGDYAVGPVTIPRKMRDVYSFRLGGELEFAKSGFSMLGGIAVENSAFKEQYLSPLTMDGDKLTLGGGFSLEMGRSMRVDLMLSHTFVRPQTVANSQVFQPQAIRPEPGIPNPIANGHYTMRNTMIGIGMVVYP